MIELDIQEYCQACVDFLPYVEYPTKCIGENGEIVTTDTIVRCSHRRRCENIRRYLEKQVKGE